MKTILSVLVVSSLLAGSAVAADADAEFHPSTYTTYKKLPPHNGSVELLDHTPLPGHYTEIGLVRIHTNKVDGYHDALAELRETAAKHGATAIVLEDDAKLFSAGKRTDRGTLPVNATATAIVVH